MGTYLSTPVTEKGQESGLCKEYPLHWGVVDMQGWRKSMEDSHIAQTEVEVPPHLQQDANKAKVFGVFDGHGGAEVARFVALYFVDVLKKQPTWVKEMQSDDPLASPVGQALIDAFHALDRMIDQPERRDELIRLRTENLEPGEQRTTDIPIPPEPGHVRKETPPSKSDEERESGVNQAIPDAEQVGTQSEARESPSVAEEKEIEAEAVGSNAKMDEPESPESSTSEPSADATGTLDDAKETANKKTAGKLVYSDPKEVADSDVTAEQQPEDAEAPEPADPDKSPVSANGAGTPILKEEDDCTEEDDPEDDDSDGVAGVDDAVKLDQDLMVEDDDSDLAEIEKPNRKVSVMFQKLLHLGGSSGQVTLKISDKDTEAEPETTEAAPSSKPDIIPTIVHNGRQICNLPDHPIHAGCTAIVAVLIGRKLTVANAGDSRGVLCRAGGRAEALSIDHKPQQDREKKRIIEAGGFVNQFGRVNGNLNLSRSIGDLKYKQVPGIHPAHQMITAEPDIVEVVLQPNDEFFILGCDGIWDCLSNIQAVKYVRDRINKMPPTDIGVQMLDEIISDDPRVTQGIGGDNMTIMIVDLVPEQRPYAKL